MKASSHPLFHLFLKQLQLKNVRHKKLLIAVSGGADSVVLLDLLTQVSSLLSLELCIGYVHHGVSKNFFRDEAQIFIHCLCEGMNLNFFTNLIQKNKKQSEQELRELRYICLKKWMQQSKSDYIALAHTADDLLETRLIRLIRGTGMQGLESMRFLDQELLRPLLLTQKKEIYDYAKFRKLIWLEDPTNSQYDSKNPFRNWIRNQWLKDLESKKQGAIKNLSQSLNRLCETDDPLDHPLLSGLITKKGLNRVQLSELSDLKQKQVIAVYFRTLQLKNYQESHIQEMLKYIHLKKQNRTFRLLGKNWLITSQYVNFQ